MSKKNDQLLTDLDAFLASSATNVEVMDEGLRAAINVPTGLEDVVRVAIEKGRSIVIAGTAGSGKTHLLRSVRADTPTSPARPAPLSTVPDYAQLQAITFRTSFAIVAGCIVNPCFC